MKLLRASSALAFLLCALTMSATPGKVRRHVGGVENQFIVMLDENTPPTAVRAIADSLGHSYNVRIIEVWPYVVRGFLAVGTPQAFDALTNDPRVAYAEQDIVMKIPANVSATQDTYVGSDNQYLSDLDRLDDPLWGPPKYPDPALPGGPTNPNGRDGKYNMCTEARDIVAYIIDYGVWPNHVEFETPTRVLQAADFTEDHDWNLGNYGPDPTNGCSTTTNWPSAWHGTAVASVLGGTNVGAAKVRIQPLKVVSCNSNTQLVFYLRAIDWIGNPSANPNYGQPAVANHSGYIPIWDPGVDPGTGASMYSAYGDAVSRLVTQQNIPFFTAANNYGGDACQFSPAYKAYTRVNHTGTVFTVSASTVSSSPSDTNDYRYVNPSIPLGSESGANGGACVSAYALATGVYHALIPSVPPGTYRRDSGTSFAAPLAAGVAARYISKQLAGGNGRPSYTAVYDFLLGQSQASVFQTSTPDYYMCITGSNGNYGFTNISSQPSTCLAGYTLFHMPATANTSDARMLYWDEANGGTCP